MFISLFNICLTCFSVISSLLSFNDNNNDDENPHFLASNGLAVNKFVTAAVAASVLLVNPGPEAADNPAA